MLKRGFLDLKLQMLQEEEREEREGEGEGEGEVGEGEGGGGGRLANFCIGSKYKKMEGRTGKIEAFVSNF